MKEIAMTTDLLEYNINARLADNDFVITITDEGGYWHIKATKDGKSAGTVIGEKMLAETQRANAMLDLAVAHLLWAWALARYHRPIEQDWNRS